MVSTRFSPIKRAKIVEAARHTSHKDVAAVYMCNLRTVSNLVAHFNIWGHHYDAPRPGRPHKLNGQAMPHLENILRAIRIASLVELINLLHSRSKRTAQSMPEPRQDPMKRIWLA